LHATYLSQQTHTHNMQYCRAGQATDDGVVHVHCMLHTSVNNNQLEERESAEAAA